MRLEYLDYLIEIDKYHSISAAAKELYIGQTTLSSIVKSVEEELGFAIFRRSRSGVETPPEGEEALALAWEISSSYEEAKQLSLQNGAGGQPVNLISSPSINCALALPLSKLFLELEPKGNLIYHETEGSEVGIKIIQNDANIGLTYLHETRCGEYISVAEKYQIQVSKVFHDHFYLLVRKDHPLAGRKSVDINELHNTDFAMLSYFSTQADSLIFTKFFQGSNRVTTFSNIALIKRAVAEQNMVSTLSGYAIHYDKSADNKLFSAIPLTGLLGENAMDLYLIHRGNRNLRYEEQTLVKCIHQYFDELPPPPFSPEAMAQPTST